VRTPLLLCIGNRLALFSFVYMGLVIERAVSHPWRAFPKNLFLDGWFRWDSGWYLRIAQDGYKPIPHDLQQPTNFFPLYPLLIRWFTSIIDNPYIAGFLISNGALVTSSVLLHQLVRRNCGPIVATRALALMLCYPFSFYFSAMYTESLFLLGAVGAFYFCQRSHWFLASICAAVAGATRLVGVLVILPVLLTYLQRCGWKLSNIRRNVIWLSVGLAGAGGHMLFLYLKFHNAVAFLNSQWVPGWGNEYTLSRLVGVVQNALSWRHLAEGSFDCLALINVTCGILAVLVCVVSYRRLNWITLLWAVLTMLISLRIWGSAGRYAGVVWPMFVGIALVTRGRPILYQTFVTGFCLLQALFAFMFTHGHWVS
jgi:hypothetical protein